MEIQQLVATISPTDLKTISEIWLNGNLDAHPFITPDYWYQHQQAVETELPKSQLYLARNNEQQIVGFAGMQADYLAGIFIARGERDAGLGTQLLDEIKANHQTIQLHVFKANSRALSFYRKNMFHMEHFEIDEDTFEMQALMEWDAE